MYMPTSPPTAKLLPTLYTQLLPFSLTIQTTNPNNHYILLQVAKTGRGGVEHKRWEESRESWTQNHMTKDVGGVMHQGEKLALHC